MLEKVHMFQMCTGFMPEAIYFYSPCCSPYACGLLHVLWAKLCFIAPCSQICCMYYELGFVLLFPVARYVACIMS